MEDENAEDDADAGDDAAEAVERALTETAKAPPRAAMGRRRKGAAAAVRTLLSRAPGCRLCAHASD